MENNISLGKASAVRIIIADELGLNPPYLAFAKMYMTGELYVTQYGRLEIGGIEANKLINEAGLTEKATELAQQFFTLKQN